jgi:hypothetical protein
MAALGVYIPDLWRSERHQGTFIREKDLTDRIVLAASKRFVQAAIEPYIANVYPVFGIRERLHLRCPDLITAMYLQFAALVDGKRPTAICQGCGQRLSQTATGSARSATLPAVVVNTGNRTPSNR